jgi:NAD(P)-dependent dehydrogenase (short-subunit alcohol dehydrogenase family)
VVSFSPGVYIITGAAGGFGNRLLLHAYREGARHFVVTVTSHPERLDRPGQHIIDDPTATLKVLVADTSKHDDCARVVEAATSMPGVPLIGVFHCAGITLDVLLKDLKDGDYDHLAACKAGGARHFHELTKDIKTVSAHFPIAANTRALKQHFACFKLHPGLPTTSLCVACLQVATFVTIGSCSAHLAGRGTATYAAANAYLGGLIRLRRSMGLPGSTFDMASLSDVGMLTNDHKVRARVLEVKRW